MADVRELQLVCIVCSSGDVYVTNQYDPRWRYYSDLNCYLVDGKTPELTFEKSWFKVAKVPTKIEVRSKEERTFLHHKLKSKFVPTPQLPEIWTFDEDDEEWDEDLLETCYERVYVENPERVVEVPFKIVSLFESNNWKPHDALTVEESKMTYGLIDRIVVHPAVLRERPCKIHGTDLYALIRKHVKENIDLRHAKITSDYDFIFTVVKSFDINTPYKHRYDAQTSTSRRARPIWKEKLVTKSEVQVLSICPKAYQDAKVVGDMHGESSEDLKRGIREYLDEIMAVVNEPVRECSHCLGRGIEPLGGARASV